MTASTARRALRVLDRLSLLTHDPDRRKPRAVRMHNLTGRAIVQALDDDDLAALVQVGAAALIEVWPAADRDPVLADTLRANTEALRRAESDALWDAIDGGRSVLFRSGQSLQDAGLVARAIGYWADLAEQAASRLGPDHPDTLASRHNLASAYRSAGDLGRAIPLFEQTLTDTERVLGPDHPDTLTSRNNLAYAYQSAGDLGRAIPLYEQTLTERERVLGPDHPDTLSVAEQPRLRLPVGRGSGPGDPAVRADPHRYGAGPRPRPPRHPEVAEQPRLRLPVGRGSGPGHPAVRADPHRYGSGSSAPTTPTPWRRGTTSPPPTSRPGIWAGRSRCSSRPSPIGAGPRPRPPGHPEYAEQPRRRLPVGRGSGPGHPAVRADPHRYGAGPRPRPPGHPERRGNNLAGAYQSAGDLGRAIPLFEQTLTDRERVLGPDHPDTLRTRQQPRRRLPVGRGSGPGHPAVRADPHRPRAGPRPRPPDTLSSRNNLAGAYQSAGDLGRAIPLFEQTLTDTERVLGPDHPDTLRRGTTWPPPTVGRGSGPGAPAVRADPGRT